MYKPPFPRSHTFLYKQFLCQLSAEEAANYRHSPSEKYFSEPLLFAVEPLLFAVRKAE